MCPGFSPEARIREAKKRSNKKAALFYSGTCGFLANISEEQLCSHSPQRQIDVNSSDQPASPQWRAPGSGREPVPGARELRQGLQALAALPEDLASVLSSWQLSTICSSSSRRSHTLSGLWRALDMQVRHTYTCRQHTPAPTHPPHTPAHPKFKKKKYVYQWGLQDLVWKCVPCFFFFFFEGVCILNPGPGVY